jgi:DNA polymerase III alpha subunit
VDVYPPEWKGGNRTPPDKASFDQLNHLQRQFTIKQMYVHLTTHSAFSLQEGLLTPTELAQAAQANGMTALGLTDHNLLTGVIEFATSCKAVDIQPIIGLEIDLNDGPVCLFATSLEGWSCLCTLSSSINLRDNSGAPCTLDMLAACSNGLIAISKQPQQLREIFSNRLYINIQDPNEAANLTNLARQLGLPTVVTHPIYYLTPEQAGWHGLDSTARQNPSNDDHYTPKNCPGWNQGSVQNPKHFPSLRARQGEAISYHVERDCFVAKDAPRNDGRRVVCLILDTPGINKSVTDRLF